MHQEIISRRLYLSERAEAVSPQGARTSATFQLKLQLKIPQVPVEGWNIFRREWVGFECNYTLHRQVKREGWRREASTEPRTHTHTHAITRTHT